MASNIAPPMPPGRQSHGDRPGCTGGMASLAAPCWWRCLGDAQLSALIERGLATAPSAPSVQRSLSAEIASRYVALRAQQTALVLLADQEELDGERLTLARRHFAPRQTIAAAAAQLAQTRADQARSRAEIAALRVRLAVLAGSALDVLNDMAGGPIPLPPPGFASDRSAAPANYRATVVAAAAAQTAAIDARAAAMRQSLRAAGEAIDAERRALAGLEREEQARATVAQAYVALARSLGPEAAAP